MALSLYLALTAAEFQKCSSLPEHVAWMACHYSPYGLGLSNLPRELPQSAMLILNDRTPPHSHNPDLIARQLKELVDTFQCGSILLDFQHPDLTENAAVVKAVTTALSCPIGVSELYARDLPCAVLLPPVPPHVPLEEYLSPWQGREIWLEAALDSEIITVTEEGTNISPPQPGLMPESGHEDLRLHCHYQTEVQPEQIRFTLFRSRDDLVSLLNSVEKQGITRAVGLYQELRDSL